MSYEIPGQSVCYGLYDGDTIVGFCAILHHPTRDNPKMKRTARLVILPDYQGIGLGLRFLSEIARIYKELGWDYCIITSSRNLIWALKNNPNWIAYRVGLCSGSQFGGKHKSRDVPTASFLYRPSKEAKK